MKEPDGIASRWRPKIWVENEEIINLETTKTNTKRTERRWSNTVMRKRGIGADGQRKTQLRARIGPKEQGSRQRGTWQLVKHQQRQRD